MKPLKTEFGKNGVLYEILDRSENYYFALLRSAESDMPIAYESGRIITHKGGKGKLGGKKIMFKASENIVSNEQFGRHPSERCGTVKDKEKIHKLFLKHKNEDDKANSKSNSKDSK